MWEKKCLTLKPCPWSFAQQPSSLRHLPDLWQLRPLRDPWASCLLRLHHLPGQVPPVPGFNTTSVPGFLVARPAPAYPQSQAHLPPATCVTRLLPLGAHRLLEPEAGASHPSPNKPLPPRSLSQEWLLETSCTWAQSLMGSLGSCILCHATASEQTQSPTTCHTPRRPPTPSHSWGPCDPTTFLHPSHSNSCTLTCWVPEQPKQPPASGPLHTIFLLPHCLVLSSPQAHRAPPPSPPSSRG